MTISKVYNNYEEMKKTLASREFISEQRNSSEYMDFEKKVHFQFAIFLEEVLTAIRGKFELKGIR